METGTKQKEKSEEITNQTLDNNPGTSLVRTETKAGLVPLQTEKKSSASGSEVVESKGRGKDEYFNSQINRNFENQLISRFGRGFSEKAEFRPNSDFVHKVDNKGHWTSQSKEGKSTSITEFVIKSGDQQKIERHTSLVSRIVGTPPGEPIFEYSNLMGPGMECYNVYWRDTENRIFYKTYFRTQGPGNAIGRPNRKPETSERVAPGEKVKKDEGILTQEHRDQVAETGRVGLGLQQTKRILKPENMISEPINRFAIKESQPGFRESFVENQTRTKEQHSRLEKAEAENNDKLIQHEKDVLIANHPTAEFISLGLGNETIAGETEEEAVQVEAREISNSGYRERGVGLRGNRIDTEIDILRIENTSFQVTLVEGSRESIQAATQEVILGEKDESKNRVFETKDEIELGTELSVTSELEIIEKTNAAILESKVVVWPSTYEQFNLQEFRFDKQQLIELADLGITVVSEEAIQEQLTNEPVTINSSEETMELPEYITEIEAELGEKLLIGNVEVTNPDLIGLEILRMSKGIPPDDLDQADELIYPTLNSSVRAAVI